jgi:hypothetical protein
MGAVYAVSLLIDQTLFVDVAPGQSPTGQVVTKLGVHTALILLYLGAAWKLIRK